MPHIAILHLAIRSNLALRLRLNLFFTGKLCLLSRLSQYAARVPENPQQPASPFSCTLSFEALYFRQPPNFIYLIDSTTQTDVLQTNRSEPTSIG